MSILFEPLTVGDLTLRNRIIMCPLTRCRAGEERIPNKMMAKYYSDRASVGLIIAEATAVDPMGVGYPHTPGIWSEEQVEGWKLVTAEVHKKGGKIFLQLWHVGRISDPIYLNGKSPLAPSAIKPAGNASLVRPVKEFETPKEMTLSEISQTIEAFRKGAENAKKAGFDGVEIHGANGYLVDQFLQTGTNKRTDNYGGTLENRLRFALEVTDAVLSVWDRGRVGFHISPRCDTHDMTDENPIETFSHLLKELGKREIAFVFARSSLLPDNLSKTLKTAFGGIYIVNQKLTKESAEEAINEGIADAAGFGQSMIANPDLLQRFKQGAALNKPKPATYYTFDEIGYNDYPTL